MNETARRPKTRRHRAALLAATVVVTAALIGGAAAAANAATTDGGSPTATPTPKPTHSSAANKHGKNLRSELRVLLHSGKNLGDEAQAIAVVIVDNHPKLYAKLPSSLKTDLTTLKNAGETDRTADATKIEKTALSGGYGSKVETVAKRIQSRASTPKSTSTPHSSGS